MPTATSGSGGYLLPGDLSSPVDDLDLDVLFQAAVVGITGLPGDLVRPRYQVNPPRRPEPDVNWCAISDVTDTPDASPWIESSGPDPGLILYWRHERLEVLASFYGPNGKRFAKIFRDGIWIPQNMEGLQANMISLVDVGAVTRASEFINQQWYQRYDVPLSFNRKIERIYPIERLTAADIHLFDDTFLDTVIPVPPTP